MPITKQSYLIQGMRQDNLVGTGFSNKFAHEIVNMRLNTIGDYTTASWTTEKGTQSIPIIRMPMSNSLTYKWITDEKWYIYTVDNNRLHKEIGGQYTVNDFKPIGQAIINDQWVLFGVIYNKDIPAIGQELPESYNVILYLKYDYDASNQEHLYGRLLYWGQLGFSEEHPIETLTFYENEQLQKVYWLDGINQPRMINIKGVEDIYEGFDSTITTHFDFIQEVSLNESVDIKKDQSGSGLFPPGTVKYLITYYKKYGPETNIVYDSPLYYPTIGERACSEDELSGDSFYIEVSNLDLQHNFDYIRLYSVIRTSNNGTPIVRIVDDKPLAGLTSSSIVIFHDTNTTGQIIDPTLIQFIGGKEIVAQTFDQKNNTLFLGNIELKTPSVTNILTNKALNDITEAASETNFTFKFIKEDLGIRKEVNDNSVYQWVSQLNQNTVYNQGTGRYRKKSANSQYVKHFKYQETYRFGIQFQDYKGNWSEVLYLNDLTNNIRPYTEEGNPECQFAGVEYRLPSEAVQQLKDSNYKKARLVCCYPTNADRTIIAQGVIAPTVYNNAWLEKHVPDAMSSWFFRPNDIYVRSANDFNPHVLPWRHNQPLDVYWPTGNSGYYYTVPEIQSTRHTVNGVAYNDWIKDRSVYKVNRQVLTFHSPEIEFDESIRTLPSDNWKVIIVGQVPINSFAAKYYLDATSVKPVYSNHQGSGLSEELHIEKTIVNASSSQYGSHCTNLGMWNDANLYTSKGKMNDFREYCLFPFQRSTSLNNYLRDIDNWKCHKYWDDDHEGPAEFPITQSSQIRSKVLSHILFSANSIFNEAGDQKTILPSVDNPNDCAKFRIFDSTEVMPLMLKTTSDAEDLVYYGNVNTISPTSEKLEDFVLEGVDSSYNSIMMSGSYPLPYYYDASPDSNGQNDRDKGIVYLRYNGVHEEPKDSSSSNVRDTGVYASDPVRISYKSTAHGVFYTSQLNIYEGTAVSISQGLRPINTEINPSSINTVQIDSLTYMPYLYLAEVQRQVDPNTRFGGKPSANHTVNNTYIPCGEAVSLDDVDGNGNLPLYGLEGDTYYMRYDNLKTYPYTVEDTNQIVEILSFMVETRINLDGRCDHNRGLIDNTIINNSNFNYINKSYTQDNNTFTFFTLDQMSAELDYFTNQITWTKEKMSGEDIDAWTNITLASTADADGTLGDITKILNFNDRLLLFQNHGIAQIQFNENTAISTETGLPLELAKTGKYTGLNYYSREVGCQNKWSISQTKNGLYWIDDSRQEMLQFGEGITSISTTFGFDAFMIQQLPSTFEPWNPKNFNNFITYYDKLSNDIYWINKNYCLGWNEQSRTFTSFYNYEAVPYMMNVGTHSLMWNNGVWAARESDTYSTFFNQTKDYSMTLVCDGMTDKGSAFAADKVFNNIEYRADIYNLNGDNINYSNSVFNIKQAWNGYQNSQEKPSDAVRKFNTWRIQLPRDYGSRDRIRNPFCYIKLKQDQSISLQTDRMILHDLAVYFDMR